MNFNQVDNRVYMKSDNPQENDIFVVVRKNKLQSPYLIVKNKNNFRLVNLSSGYMNEDYKGVDIDDLVKNYFDKNISNDGGKAGYNLNPIIEYFFVKGFKASISISDTFGYNRL